MNSFLYCADDKAPVTHFVTFTVTEGQHDAFKRLAMSIQPSMTDRMTPERYHALRERAVAAGILDKIEFREAKDHKSDNGPNGEIASQRWLRDVNLYIEQNFLNGVSVVLGVNAPSATAYRADTGKKMLEYYTDAAGDTVFTRQYNEADGTLLVESTCVGGGSKNGVEKFYKNGKLYSEMHFTDGMISDDKNGRAGIIVYSETGPTQHLHYKNGIWQSEADVNRLLRNTL